MQNQRTSTMSTPNPLMPQGALQGPSSTVRQKTFAMIFTIVALHVAVIVVVLMQGCKREESVNYAEMSDPAMLPPNEGDDGFHSPENPAPVGGDTSVAGAPAAGATPVVEPRSPVAAAASTGTPLVTPSAPPASLPPTAPPTDIPATPAGSVVPAPAVAPASVAAASGASAPPPAAIGMSTYSIRRGDSFYSIAKRYSGVSHRDIERANPSVDPGRLRIGQTINIPVAAAAAAAPAPAAPRAATTSSSEVAAVYTVQPGDNLTKIADKYRTTVTRIKRANGMRGDTIRIGQKLNIPAP